MRASPIAQIRSLVSECRRLADKYPRFRGKLRFFQVGVASQPQHSIQRDDGRDWLVDWATGHRSPICDETQREAYWQLELPRREIEALGREAVPLLEACGETVPAGTSQGARLLAWAHGALPTDGPRRQISQLSPANAFAQIARRLETLPGPVCEQRPAPTVTDPAANLDANLEADVDVDVDAGVVAFSTHPVVASDSSQAKPELRKDREQYVLLFNGRVVKRFRGNAESQVRLCLRFQKAGWPPSLPVLSATDKPMDRKAAKKLVAALNHGAEHITWALDEGKKPDVGIFWTAWIRENSGPD